MVGGLVFAVVLTLTLVRSILLVDALVSPPGASSKLAARATHAVSSRVRVEVAQGPSPASRQQRYALASPRQRTSANTATVRTLHNRLMAMHFVSAVHMMTGTVRYYLPVSTMSCRVTAGLLLFTILLYDASLVLFLLAKTSVTNGNRALSRWETCITWWSRFYSWVYLPACSIMVGVFSSSGVNDESTHCTSGSNARGDRTEFSDLSGYLSNNVMLIIQFVLLLAMFVKPMLVPQGSTQSGGAMYRRVVIRNIVCTAGIVLTYAGTTLVVILKWISDGTGMEEKQIVTDVTPAINMILTLCLTEIALPLGFSSCFKSVMAARHLDTNKTCQLVGSTMMAKDEAQTITEPTQLATKHQPTANIVVPSEGAVP